jgi:signal transduction histidine kinase/ligand-binding sensor domain-containing protein
VSSIRKHVHTLRFALCICLFLTISASVPAERLPVRIYTSADGLGSSFVSYLMRDSHGFMWFCTRDGLSRFDGSRFVTYQIGDKNSPPGIEQILETRAGIYWIETTGGLYRFDPNAAPSNKTQNTDRPKLNAVLMSADRGTLSEDRSGNLWLGSTALYRLEEKDGKLSQHEVELNLPVNPVTPFGIVTIREGQDESLWIATTWGLVRRLPDGREIFYNINVSRTDAMTAALEDRAGRIWIGGIFGVSILKPEPLDELTQLGDLTVRALDDVAQPRSQKQEGLPEQPGEIFKYTDVMGSAESDAAHLYETADGHVWISGGDGVIEFDGRTFIPHTTAQGLLKGSGEMAEDTSGNLWLGWSTGLMRLDRHGLTTYDAADGLKSLAILALGENREGKLYVGGAGFFLSQFDGKGFQTIRPPLPPNAGAIWTSNEAFQDHTGEWWFLTNEKLYRFAASPNFNELAQQRPLATYTSRDGLKGNQMFHIFEDSKGDLWVSTRGSTPAQLGLSRWDRATEKFYTFSSAEGFPSGKEPSSFAEDRDGTLWLGFYEGGLVHYANGRFTEFTTADGLPDGVITALHLDRQGRLWMASSLSGLSHLDDSTADHPRFVNYSTDNGLSSNNVRSLTEDFYGNLYAGTARGVDKLSPDLKHIQHYSVREGLTADFVNIAFRDKSGVLWFGTPNGLSRLAPEADHNAAAPPVWLGSLRIAGENHPLPELGVAEISDLELSPTQNNLQIEFFGVDFNAGETLRYQYMLEGADKDWSAPTEQRTVNYANLASGSYRFLVRAVNADGVSSAHPASISLRVWPPFWRRWWFIALAALVFGSIVFALDRYRIARLDERRRAEEALRRTKEERLVELERVRTRIATDLHDDIGSSLTQIVILSEVAQQHVNGTDGPLAEPLTKITTVSNELVEAMSDIVWAINPKKDHLSDLVQRMRRFASDIFAPCQIRFNLHALTADDRLQLGANMRRELFLIFKECVNNIAKHSGCTEADVEFYQEGGSLVLKLSDNGKGFDLAAVSEHARTLRGGNGLLSMRRRAEELGGTFEMSSSAGEGTSVKLKVPLAQQSTIESPHPNGR